MFRNLAPKIIVLIYVLLGFEGGEGGGPQLRAATDEVRQKITYQTFLEQVAAHHPQRAVDEKTLGLSKGAESRTGLLPDPELSVGRDQVPFPNRFQRADMASMPMAGSEAQTTYSLSQRFPWPGTLSAEDRAARARTGMVKVDTDVSALGRHFEAAELFFRMVRTAKLIEIERADVKVVGGIRDFAHEKFKQGIGSHMAYLQTHSEAGVLQANIAALELDLRNLKRHALLLVDSPAGEPPDAADFVLEWPQVPSASQAAGGKAAVPPVDLIRESIVAGKTAEMARQEAEYHRTLPSFTASGMIMQEDGGMRMYAGTVGVSLPIFSNFERSALSREKAITGSRAEDELSWHGRRKALALAQAESRIAQIEANLRALAGEIIPPVREHIAAAIAQFSQGKGDIASIIDGRRILLNLQMTEIRTAEALARAHLGVERIQAGLVDDEIDLEVPQLAGASSPAGMAMGGGGGAGGANDRMPGGDKRSMPERAATSSTRRKALSPPGRTTETPADQDADKSKSGNNSGMGM